MKVCGNILNRLFL